MTSQQNEIMDYMEKEMVKINRDVSEMAIKMRMPIEDLKDAMLKVAGHIMGL